MVALIKSLGGDTKSCLDRESVNELAINLVKKATRYNLVANLCHDSPPGEEDGKRKMDPLTEGSYRAHIRSGERSWFEMQDLHVTDVLPQVIVMSETYLLVYERAA